MTIKSFLFENIIMKSFVNYISRCLNITYDEIDYIYSKKSKNIYFFYVSWYSSLRISGALCVSISDFANRFFCIMNTSLIETMNYIFMTAIFHPWLYCYRSIKEKKKKHMFLSFPQETGKLRPFQNLASKSWFLHFLIDIYSWRQ